MWRLKSSRIIVPLLLSIFSFCYVYGIAGFSSRRTQGFHGLQHSAYVYQLVNGIIPPTNSNSIGAPAHLYWGWHALVALSVRIFNKNSLEVLLFINACALSISLLFMWFLSGRITNRLLPRIASLTWPFFILNPVRIVKELLIVFFDDSTVVHLLKPWLYSKNYLFMIKGFVDIRPANFIGKFLNFTSFPTAVCLVLVVFGMVISSRPGRSGVRLIFVGILSFLTAFFHPISVVALGVLLGVFALDRLVPLLISGRLSYQVVIKVLTPPLVSAAGILCALPYVISLSTSFSQPVDFHLPLSGKDLSYEGWALVPSIPLYAFYLYKLRTLNSEMRVIFMSGIILSVLTLIVILPDHNEYKFTLYFALITALLVVDILNRMCIYADTRQNRVSQFGIRSLIVFTVLVSLVPFIVVGKRYLSHAWSDQDPYVYGGMYARLRESNGKEGVHELQEALDWIRENTLPADYILTRPVSGNNNQIPFLTGRRTVACTADISTGTIPYHDELERAAREAVQALVECSGCAEALLKLERVPAKWPDILYALVESNEACPSDQSLSLVYQNARYKIYKIHLVAIAPDR